MGGVHAKPKKIKFNDLNEIQIKTRSPLFHVTEQVEINGSVETIDFPCEWSCDGPETIDMNRRVGYVRNINTDRCDMYRYIISIDGQLYSCLECVMSKPTRN